MTTIEVEQHKARIIALACDWLGYRFGSACYDPNRGLCDDFTTRWRERWSSAHLDNWRTVARLYFDMELERQRAIGAGHFGNSYTPSERSAYASATPRSVWLDTAHAARRSPEYPESYYDAQRTVYRLVTHWKDGDA
jgi:hypothetical protein